ncbi:Uncharacterised protein [Bordetella ansorpii]|uniref:Uncharacterized protein n=1 Tax=Bordetella ansorpii TaxID=288768 RepID=A0A157PA94_9BORD|nr:Uncharacterised protein [Bordetella ansorpii]
MGVNGIALFDKQGELQNIVVYAPMTPCLTDRALQDLAGCLRPASRRGGAGPLLSNAIKDSR